MARAVLMFGFVAGLAAFGPAEAAPVARQAIDDPWKTCAAQAARQEAALNLPHHLLSAIGKAESGRWDEAGRANVAWPWTVTAEGEGRFFDTKAEALAEVRRLKARRVSNIDVGCMQVNLGYHGHRFASIEEAMDPVANTAYAARFLKTLRATSADWM
ncbi:MAG: murein transglycosylase, partial [Rhodospirillales bacterium]|nr:murein transglycosylase [Rhodospirillales bacterium]